MQLKIIHVGQMLLVIVSYLLTLQNLHKTYLCLRSVILRGFKGKRAFQGREKPK